MLSNLSKGLSQRVIRALHDRLHRAMSAEAAATLPSGPEGTGPEVADTTVPNVNIPGEDTPGDVGADLGDRAPPPGGAVDTRAASPEQVGGVQRDQPGRDRSRTPRRGEQPLSVDDERQKLKDEVRQELLKEVLSMVPPLSPGEATPDRLLQSNMSLGVATVSLCGKLAECVKGLRAIQESMNTMGSAMTQGHLSLTRSLKDMAVSIESLAAGTNYHGSQTASLKGEVRQIRDWIKWSFSKKPQGEFIQEVVAALEGLQEVLIPCLNGNSKVVDERLVQIEKNITTMVEALDYACSQGGLVTLEPEPSAPAFPFTPMMAPMTPNVPHHPPPPPVGGAKTPQAPGPLRVAMPVHGAASSATAGVRPGPPPMAPMGVIKHVFYLGEGGRPSQGPIPGKKVNPLTMQEEVSRNLRSVSPTPYEQTFSQQMPWSFAPKGWAIAHDGKCYRLYD